MYQWYTYYSVHICTVYLLYPLIHTEVLHRYEYMQLQYMIFKNIWPSLKIFKNMWSKNVQPPPLITLKKGTLHILYMTVWQDLFTCPRGCAPRLTVWSPRPASRRGTRWSPAWGGPLAHTPSPGCPPPVGWSACVGTWRGGYWVQHEYSRGSAYTPGKPNDLAPKTDLSATTTAR